MWYKIKSFIIKWFGNIQIFPYPFFIMFGHTSYRMRGDDVQEVLNTIQPGDILLRRYNHYISGLMIPGHFTHAAIYMGDDKVVHMLGEGINKESILSFCRCDEIAIIHCLSEQITKIAIKKAAAFYKDEIKYDFDFNFSEEKEFSCTELINDIFDNPKMCKIKENYILPDDFLTLDNSIFSVSYRKG
jgi:uncharacterized protein YycO